MFKTQPIGFCELHNMSNKGTERSRLLGENMQALVAGGVPLVRALDATLKAFDH